MRCWHLTQTPPASDATNLQGKACNPSAASGTTAPTAGAPGRCCRFAHAELAVEAESPPRLLPACGAEHSHHLGTGKRPRGGDRHWCIAGRARLDPGHDKFLSVAENEIFENGN